MTVQLSSLRVSADLDASKYVAGAQQKQNADRAMVASAKDAATAASQVDTRLSQSGDVLSRLSRQYVDGYASAQRFNGAITALTNGVERGKIEMTQASVILDGIYKKYGMMADASRIAERGQLDLARAVEQANSKFMKQQDIVPANQNAGGLGGRNFAATNAMFQFQDIGMTAAMGMNPGMIALQQGSQLAGAYAGLSMKEAAATTGAALAGLVSPVSIAAIGFTALAAAAIQYGVSVVGSINTSASALEKHEEALKRIKALYDTAAESGEQFGQRTQSAITFTANQDRQALQKALADGLKNFAYRASPTPDASQYQFPGADMAGLEQQQLRDNFGPFASTVSKFLDQAREGKGDVLELNKQIQELANSDPANKAMQRIATTILGYTDQATKAAEAVKELNKQQLELTMTMARTEAAASARKYEADNTYQRFAMTRQYDAEVAGIGARSPQQIADATRRRLEAEPVDPGKESVETRALRIQQQVDLAYRQANQSVIEAQQSRAQSLDKMLTDQQMEIDLLGKTGGAAVALRKEYELTSQLRLEAARQGIEVDQRELDMIKERAAALGQLTDLYNQRRFNTDMAQQGADADMLGPDRQIVQTLRQYGLPEDLGGGNASIIRDSLNREAARTAISGFMTDFRSNLLRNGGDIGEALGDTIKNALLNALSKASEQAIERLTNTIVGALFGARPAGGGIVSSVANDNVAGGFSGLAKVIPVTRSALPTAGATGDIASYIRQSAIARGIDPEIALRVARSEGGTDSWNLQSNFMKNGVREPSYGPFQLYTGGGLGNDFQNRTGLDPRLAQNGPAGVDFALDHASKNGWGAWYGAAKVGVDKWDGIGQGGGSVAAVNKLADSASSAAGNLNTFGGGLDKLGTGLTNVGSNLASGGATAASGGGGSGGLFGWLGGLFGGGTSQWNLAKSGAITGLFADGTGSAPGGLAVVGERGREIVNLPRGSQVIPNHRTESMMAANRNGGGVGSGGRLDIGVSVDDEGALRAYVKRESSSAARTETASAFSAYGDSQRRGQFGEMQRRYSNQKG